MIQFLNSLALAHNFIESNVKNGDNVIDATAGRGRDAEFLCSLVGESGHVYAFDIQEEAILSARELLDKKGLSQRVTLILDSHENMKNYVADVEISAVVFNFGYLPGGDHSIQTRPEVSVAAIDAATSIIKQGGIVSLCIYYGGDSGYLERDALLNHIKTLDNRKFTVITHEFSNRPNCPPVVVDIQKHIGVKSTGDI